MNYLQRKLGAMLCAAIVALSALAIAPKAAYASETYTVSLSHDGGITKQTLIGDYELGTEINLISGGISQRLGDILNSYTALVHVGNVHLILPYGDVASSFYTDNGDITMNGTTCAFHSEGEMECGFQVSVFEGVGRHYVRDVKVSVTKNRATISFKPNGGTGSMEPQVVPTNTLAPLDANAFTRENARFVGWNTEADGSGTSYCDGEPVTIATDLTLYAQWELSHAVKVTDNGHGTASANKARAYEGETISLAVDSVVDGYVFEGWQVVSGGVRVDGDAFAMGGSDVEIKAVFLPRGYTLAYDANGGEGQMDDVRLAFDEETTLGPCAFARTGYAFTGWEDRDGATYEDGATVKNLTNVEGSTVTMRAQWKSNSYTVAYDPNGADGTMENQTFSYDEEKPLTTNAFTRAGYRFLGWKGSDGKSYADAQVVKNLTATDGETITMTAQWELITYTVRFDANGGSGSMAPQVMQALVPTALTTNAFTREDYSFTGWNTKADGTGTRVADGIKVKLDADLTLYAQWKKTGQKVEKKADQKGGKATKSTKAAKKNAGLPKTDDPTSMVAVAATALLGASALVAGIRRRRK